MLLRILLIWVVLAWAPGPASASDTEGLVLGGQAGRDAPVSGHLHALRDPGGNLDIAAARARGFAPVVGGAADFGYTEDAIWLRVAVRNADPANRDWRMHFRSNFLPEFAVWMVDAEGRTTLLEDQRPQSPFQSRALPYPELTVPFVLPPGDSGTIYIRYRSGGSSNLSFVIRSADSFAALSARQTARNFVFYGMMLFLTGAAFLACLLTWRPIFAAYGCYACVAMLFVMHADGNTFQYLWPGAPVFNAYASVLLGAGLVVFGANFARMFLRTAVFHPVLNAVLIGFMGLALALVALTAFGLTQEVKKFLVLLAFLSTILFTVAGLVAARTRFREVRFYVIAWLGAVVASAIMTARHWLGIEISEELQYDAMRVVMVTDAVMMGLAILDSVNQIRQAQRKTLEKALDQARRSLDLSRRLTQLEDRYAMVVAHAQLSERRLADTAHDLRQPLTALRLNVQRLLDGSVPAGTPGRLREDFEESFDYLERLVASELDRRMDQAGPAPATDAAADAPVPAGPVPPPTGVSVDDILGTVIEMFAPTAVARDVEVRRVRTRARTSVLPLVLMRIASNLVSNAIKHGGPGRVLIGVRHVGGALRLEVHDTGPGLSDADFARARTRAFRLEAAGDAEGAGLGLAIVERLAGEHGLTLALCPGRRGGTGISVTLSQV